MAAVFPGCKRRPVPHGCALRSTPGRLLRCGSKMEMIDDADRRPFSPQIMEANEGAISLGQGLGR